MQHFLIVGCTSGIGKALTNKLLENGQMVTGVGRQQNMLRKFSEKFPDRFSAIVLDLRETATIEATLNESLKNRPVIDVVVLLSSITGENPELEWPLEENVIRTNVLGWSAVALWAAHYFERQGKGHLVGITSLAKYLASVNPSYIASKAFEGKLLDGLRLRLEPKGIWVTEILPGFVETPMIARQKRKFWAISAEKAAHCILGSIEKKKRRAVISKRWKIFRLLAPHISARLQLKIFKL